MKIIKHISLIIVIILLLCASAVYALLFTTAGARWLTTQALEKYMPYQNWTIENIDGRLSQEVICRNIQIKDLPKLPRESTLKIQQLVFSLTAA